ncbi:uncharacterized protein LOC113217651 [Frankliniella occidentalis]|uniref:Uncharacterized protein LOC113217651 n=1 Tax=Frankliniella occidentalis TaxID=133901 RepID=A0A6J1TIT9_FRAOC|nr:uncharacterized protein LOC113217651 [Frankliniella occidentalis]
MALVDAALLRASTAGPEHSRINCCPRVAATTATARRNMSVSPLLLLAVCSVSAVVLKNGAPCLEGRVAVSSAEIQKDDWACFVFCSDGHRSAAAGHRNRGLCRRCCLDPGQAVDGGAGAGAAPDATTAPDGVDGGSSEGSEGSSAAADGEASTGSEASAGTEEAATAASE